MTSQSRVRGAIILILALLPCPALPCSLCVNIRQTPTLRQEAARPTTRIILHGTLENPRLRGPAGAGTVDFRVLDVLKTDPSLPERYQVRKSAVLTLPYYVPLEDNQRPPHYLLFCDVCRDGLLPVRRVPIDSAVTADYLRQAIALPAADVRSCLSFFFRYLDHPDPQISTDAFMEFARASDQDIGELGRVLKPEPLRRWLKDERTPEDRLTLFAMLLGACGTREDAVWFQAVLAKPSPRYLSAFDGLLAGLIQLRPRDGWEMAEKVLREGSRPLPVRLSVERMLRFFMAWRPQTTREAARRCLAAIVTQGEMVDLAAEDLRHWQMWELTPQVLALYGRKGLDAPIHRRAILRYALSCPTREAQAFVVAVRQRDPETVREVEDGLRGLDDR